MYGLHIPFLFGKFESRNPLVFLVSFKGHMFLLIWTKFEENIPIGFVLIYFTHTSSNRVKRGGGGGGGGVRLDSGCCDTSLYYS